MKGVRREVKVVATAHASLSSVTWEMIEMVFDPSAYSCTQQLSLYCTVTLSLKKDDSHGTRSVSLNGSHPNRLLLFVLLVLKRLQEAGMPLIVFGVVIFFLVALEPARVPL